MTPIDWAKRPIFEKYADFSGRAPRPEYWWFVLANIVLYFVATIIDSLLGLNTMIAGIYGPLTLIVAFGLLIPGLAAAVRRLHDTNRSGWWMLLVIVPYFIFGFLMARSASSIDPATGMPTGEGMGSMALVGLLALAGAIAMIVFLVLPGTDGDNKYGPKPASD
jgi:uncharacterized membrane protein YhaH (DUF805 family)